MCISTAQARTKSAARLWSAAFLPVNSRIKWLLWHVHVRFDWAGSNKTAVAALVCGIFTCKFSHKMTLVTCPCAFRPHRLAQKRLSLWEDLVEILVTSFLRGPCMIWYRSLWEDLVEILIESSLRRSCGDPGEILSKRSLHDLAQLLMQRSCGNPGEILSYRGPSRGDPNEII